MQSPDYYSKNHKMYELTLRWSTWKMDVKLFEEYNIFQGHRNQPDAFYSK